MRNTLDIPQEKRIGIALSGGAVRGLAHIGVIKVLQEIGVKPVAVTGTSVGSLIGAAFAAGMHWSELARLARTIFWPTLLHGGSLVRFSNQYLPPNFEDLQTPFAAVATDISFNEPHVIKRGPLSSALSASCAVRFLRQPVVREGVKLKDGGFTCVLPTHPCRELGVDFVIASDVWEWSSVMRSFGLTPARTPRFYPAHYHLAMLHTDIHIHPEIPVSGYVPRASAVDQMIAVGERATRQALNLF